MTDPTPLDQAHAAMQAEPGDTARRMRYYERLADAELFMLLEHEADEGKATPRIFALEQGDVALVFDRQERLADFTGTTTPYLALSGRTAVAMLTGKEIGLGVNLGVAGSSFLLGYDAVVWLADFLAVQSSEIHRRPVALTGPKATQPALLQALDTKLAMSPGLAKTAYLVHARYSDGSDADLLAIIDAIPAAQPALTRAIGEAVLFSGLDAASIDVGFFLANDPLTADFQRVGLGFELPRQQSPASPALAPGMDPDNPPRLR
jgi:SseB protein N-terminal domain